MPGARLDSTSMARRAAQEIKAGEAVAVGSGLATAVPGAVPAGSGVWFLSESGAVGYRSVAEGKLVDSAGSPAEVIPGGTIVGVADLAAMVAGGNVGLAFVEAAQASVAGDFVHWTTAETPGLAAPGFAVDLASGARRVVAVMQHTGEDGAPRILERCDLPVDGNRCVSLIVTDIAAIRVTAGGLELAEVAPGWTSDDVTAVTAAPLSVAL